MRRNVRLGGFAAAVSVIALVTPLMAMDSAQAIIPKADLSIVKTVASHGPTIDLDPALSQTLSRGHVEWEELGAHIYTTFPTSLCTPVVLQNCATEVAKMQIAEYVDTSTPLSEVVTPPGNPQFPYPYVGFVPTNNNAVVGPDMHLIVDMFGNGNPATTFKLVRSGWNLNDPWKATTLANVPLTSVQAGIPPYDNSAAQATLAAWLAVYGNAKVTAFGFATPALGQGLGPQLDGTVQWISLAGVRYDLARVYKPSISAAPGDSVTYKIVVANGSGADTKTAAGVDITDVLPPEFSYDEGTLSTSWPCSFASDILSCTPITLAPGASRTVTFEATLADEINTNSLPSTPGHAVDVQHQVVAADLLAGQTKSVTASCPAGYIATDGGLLIDSIGQGADYSDVVVNSSKPVTNTVPDPDINGWAVTATNLGNRLAQGKVTVTCLDETIGTSTGHTHELVTASGAGAVITGGLTGVPNRPLTATCPTGDTPYAPRYDVTNGVAVIRESYAVDNVWHWTVDHSDGTVASFGISCLAPETDVANGHTATLTTSTPDDTIAVGPETRVEGTEPCPDDSNAIVGGYGSDDTDILSLGMAPQGGSYLLRFYNQDWDSTHNADIQVTCVGDTTDSESAYLDVVNTAYVTATTKDRSYSDNSDSATVAVFTDGVPTTPNQPSGVTLSPLTATRTTNGNGKTTAITLTMWCNLDTTCSFTVKGLVNGGVVATKTTSLNANSLTGKPVVVPTTSLGKNLGFGDTVTVKIKTSKGTTQYAVGLVS